MDIEQLPPNGPNFPLIVGIFAATILLVLFGAYLFVRYEGNPIAPAKHATLQWTPVGDGASVA